MHSSLVFAVALLAIRSIHALSSKKPQTYNYFAFGSNMCSSTMINLRNTSPLAYTAAILPGHSLRFNIPGLIKVEPSSASVEPIDGELDFLDQHKFVHGTLYKLSEEDFSTICRTEGVPFAYNLHRCRVIPYKGDGKRAGIDCLEKMVDSINTSDALNLDDIGVPAFTLRAARKKWREAKDIPPSQSYLNVLIRGAVEFQVDDAYLKMLKNIKPGKTFIGGGLAEEMLRLAEMRAR
jgi:hypothetical protein